MSTILEKHPVYVLCHRHSPSPSLSLRILLSDAPCVAICRNAVVCHLRRPPLPSRTPDVASVLLLVIIGALGLRLVAYLDSFGSHRVETRKKAGQSVLTDVFSRVSTFVFSLFSPSPSLFLSSSHSPHTRQTRSRSLAFIPRYPPLRIFYKLSLSLAFPPILINIGKNIEYIFEFNRESCFTWLGLFAKSFESTKSIS